MKHATKVALFVLVAVFSIGADGCDDNGNQKSASGATQATPVTVPKNSKGFTCEQQNIQDRIRVTTDPTKIMWIHLITIEGKVVSRLAVRNKITSAGKRLEPTKITGVYSSSGINNPRYNEWTTDELMGPDGTYGSSGDYNYWFDPMGRYNQLGQAGGIGYLLTDYPIDLDNPIDKITGLYNMQLQAAAWQQVEEAKLKKSEGK